MKHFSKARWHAFKEALRRHWPNLTDEEIDATFGDYRRVEELIESKQYGPADSIKETLSLIYDEVSEGHTEDIDHYSGIKKEQTEPHPPLSSEWEAREDQNRP